MNKKIFVLLLCVCLFTACSKESTNNAKLVSKDKKNYSDIQKALQNDPINAGTDKNQNPDDYVKDKPKGAGASKDEYVKEINNKDKLTREELNKKRDEDIKDGIINISDGIFLPLVNDVYLNKDEYVGKKIRISGQIVKFEDEQIDEVIYAILREGPGCCYNDSVIGFEFITDLEKPEPQKWYELVGEVILDTKNAGKVVKLKALEFKEVEPKAKLFHFGG